MKTAPEQRPPYKPDNASLREAISLAQQGDGSAFELLYRLHCKRVYALCLRMVGVASEAEELTQEAFLQVFRKIHTFRGESAFSTWLHRLTANIVLMHFRKKRLISNPFEDTNTTDEETDGARLELPAVDLRLAGLFDRLDLQIAMDRLPKGCKAVFLLHDVQGYRHNEIAKLLGFSTGASKSQLHKARQRLRSYLRKMQHRAESTHPRRFRNLLHRSRQVDRSELLGPRQPKNSCFDQLSSVRTPIQEHQRQSGLRRYRWNRGCHDRSGFTLRVG
jgi:RNA polymerase sigma-70 factor, ECF subfamily